MYTFAKLSVLSRIVWIDPLVREVTLSEHQTAVSVQTPLLHGCC